MGKDITHLWAGRFTGPQTHNSVCIKYLDDLLLILHAAEGGAGEEVAVGYAELLVGIVI